MTTNYQERFWPGAQVEVVRDAGRMKYAPVGTRGVVVGVTDDPKYCRVEWANGRRTLAPVDLLRELKPSPSAPEAQVKVKVPRETPAE
jgi:hypothetical protein